MAQYINYGDLLVDLETLMTNLANDVLNYVANQPWSRKRKEKFMYAYTDLINRGILGASNNSGQWVLDVKGDPFPEMGKKDKEMYGEAAYFIQQQMAKLPTKASIEEEEKKKLEEKKAKLIPFNSDTFKNEFLNQLSKDWFGGNNEILASLWNEYDKRDTQTGLRDRTRRAEMFSQTLDNYLKNLEANKDKYNFENSPLGDLETFKRKVAEAKAALTTTDNTDDDFEKLNALGLNASTFFSNGSEDPITLEDGRVTTYGKLAKYNEALAKQKAEEEAKKELERRANQYTNYIIFGNTMVGKNPTDLSKYQNIYDLLNSYAKLSNLTPDQKSELVGFFKLAAKNNALVSLSKEEKAKFGKYWGNRVQYLRKVDGLNGFYWNTLDNSVILPYNATNNNLLTNLQEIINLNNPEAIALKKKEQAEINMNTPLSQMSGEWTPEMKKEIEALAWDAASILNPEAFSGSAMATRAAWLRGLANPNRSTLESVFDYGTAGLGGIQGFGDLLVTGKLGYRLYLLGKSIGSVSKFAGLLGAGFGAIGAYLAKDSIAKLATDRDSLTPQDFENIAYGLMGLIGLKSFATARNKQLIRKQANPTVTEHSITIKDKNETHKIKIDENTAKDIQLLRTFGKKKATVDSEILNMPKVKESIEKYKKANPTKKLETEGASIVNDSKIGRNKVVTSKQVKDSNAPQYEPVGTNYFLHIGKVPVSPNFGYVPSWQRRAWESVVPEQSSKGLWLRVKEFWNPEPKVKNKTSSTETSNSVEAPKTESKSFTPEEIKLLKEKIKEFNKYTEGTAKHSGNNLSEEPFKAGDFNFEVNKFPNSSAGNIDISFNGNNKTISFKNLKDMMKKVALFLKDNRKLTDVSGTIIKKINAKEMGEILRQLKTKGVFKQGGTIDKQKIQLYKKYINK